MKKRKRGEKDDAELGGGDGGSSSRKVKKTSRKPRASKVTQADEVKPLGPAANVLLKVCFLHLTWHSNVRRNSHVMP